MTLSSTVADSDPRDVLQLHKMRIMLNIVEIHGSQLHMKIGESKCKLLISLRPKMLKQVEELLSSEPDILTLYSKPISLVQETNTPIHVPQAARRKIVSNRQVRQTLWDLVQQCLRDQGGTLR